MPSSRQEELLPSTSQSAAAPVKKPRNWVYWAIPTAILVAAVVGITVGVVVGKGGSSSSSDGTATAAGAPASAVASPSPSPASSSAVPSPSPAASSPAASEAAAGGSAPVASPLPTPTPSPSPSPSPEPVAVKSGYTAAEVAAHNTPTDCWYIYGTKVVDITSYIAKDLHPGGNDIMFPCCGTDCTKDFDREHRGNRALREQASYYIGDLQA